MARVRLLVELPEELALSALRELLEMNDVVVRQCEVEPPQRGTSSNRLRSVRLSPAELAVLKAFAYCDTTADIAARLGISESTVKTHTHNLFGKLRVHNRACAVGHALRLGLISVQDLSPPSRGRKNQPFGG